MNPGGLPERGPTSRIPGGLILILSLFRTSWGGPGGGRGLGGCVASPEARLLSG